MPLSDQAWMLSLSWIIARQGTENYSSKKCIFCIFVIMVIERTNNEIIFRLPADIDTAGFERIINYLKYKEAIRKSQGTEQQADELANESKKRWWAENKEKYIK